MPSELKSRWPQVGSAVSKAKNETLLKQGDIMKFRLIGEMYKPKSGRIYGSHQASAPGEAPASETTELERSIAVDPKDIQSIAAINQVSVGTDVEYAMTLEFGGGRVAPRPNFEPVGEEMTPEVTQALTTSTRSAIESNSLR